MKKKVAIIGSGFSGLSAAAYAAKAGHEVHVLKNTISRAVEPDNLPQSKVLFLTWDQVGIGCLILWINFLLISATKPQISLI
jgi:cation diffusion facilitator CzcD-associated flavoprotein CzcO